MSRAGTRVRSLVEGPMERVVRERMLGASTESEPPEATLAKVRAHAQGLVRKHATVRGVALVGARARGREDAALPWRIAVLIEGTQERRHVWEEARKIKAMEPLHVAVHDAGEFDDNAKRVDSELAEIARDAKVLDGEWPVRRYPESGRRPAWTTIAQLLDACHEARLAARLELRKGERDGAGLWLDQAERALLKAMVMSYGILPGRYEDDVGGLARQLREEGSNAQDVVRVLEERLSSTDVEERMSGAVLAQEAWTIERHAHAKAGRKVLEGHVAAYSRLAEIMTNGKGEAEGYLLAWRDGYRRMRGQIAESAGRD